mmetsp:Transcript_3698/g.6299  ORF Transcript_3698/g.6299 Transcript_3698/m.6299 type:complete len:218 (+) Transcript_3698:242-895(+)
MEGGQLNLRHHQIVHPQVRGLLQDSDIQSIIWKQFFSRTVLHNPKGANSGEKLREHLKSSCLSLTSQPLTPPMITERYAEMAFEDFEFDALAIFTPHSMIRESALQQISEQAPLDHPRQQVRQCSSFPQNPYHLVIDSGFSSTYGVPFFGGIPMKQAAIRIDVGGKLLTNLLGEILSQKQFNLQGEFSILNQLKEQTSFLCPDDQLFKSYESQGQLK